MIAPHFIASSGLAQPRYGSLPDCRSGTGPYLKLLELRVAFDELLRAAPRETHAYAAIIVLTFNTNYRADSILGMTHFLPEQWIGIRSTLDG